MADLSLFEDEERTIEEARQAITSCTMGHGPSMFNFEKLLSKYEKLVRQVRSLVKISDRMQRELNRLNERLKESEQKYRSIFENVTDGIFRSDQAGRLVDANPALAKILGYDSTRELRNLDLKKSVLVQEKEADLIWKTLVNKGRINNYQVEAFQKSEKKIWLEFSARTITNPHGQLVLVEGIVSDVTERKKLQDELEYLAITDELTGLYNRRYFFDLAHREFSRSLRHNTPLSILIFDVDHFKAVNDRYGHDVGDLVLKHITETAADSIREHDIIGRFGGEEFTVLLPDTGLMGANTISNRLREAVAEQKIPTPVDSIQLTISIGFVTRSKDTPDIDAMFKKADQALYLAKERGRNRVETI